MSWQDCFCHRNGNREKTPFPVNRRAGFPCADTVPAFQAPVRMKDGCPASVESSRVRGASSMSALVPIGFRETGGTANAGSKRNGMWPSPKAASTASHAMRPSGKSKAAMKGEKVNACPLRSTLQSLKRFSQLSGHRNRQRQQRIFAVKDRFIPSLRSSMLRALLRVAMSYTELHACSAFSFLRGASKLEDLVPAAARLGLPALALCDRDGLYGSPRLHAASKEHGARALVGAELTLEDKSVLPVLVASRTGYQNLAASSLKPDCAAPRRNPRCSGRNSLLMRKGSSP